MEEPDTLINAILNEVNTVNNVCTLCSLIMENNQPRIELMCHHTFHTACFLSEIYMHGGNYCSSCNEAVFTRETREDAYEKDQQLRKVKQEKYLKKFQENQGAVEDLKLIKKQITKTKKTREFLNKYIRIQRTEHKEESEQLSKLLKDMVVKRKKKVITSEQYSKWKTEKIRLQRYINVFNQKYRNFQYHELELIPELKLPSRWTARRFTQLYSWRFDRYFR